MGVYSSRTNSPIKSSNAVRALPPASATADERIGNGRSVAAGNGFHDSAATTNIATIAAIGRDHIRNRRRIAAPLSVVAHFGHRTANRQAPTLTGAA